MKPWQIALAVLLMVGCEGRENRYIRNPKLVALKDESTLNERKVIEETIQKITAFENEFGVYVDFRRLPVFVTTRNDFDESKYFAICDWDEKHNGIKIVLNRSAFSLDEGQAEGLSSQIFLLLLHEIGHCYFRRGHECAALEKPGYYFEFVAGGLRSFSYSFIPVSIMYDECNRDFSFPKVLEKYYVGEVVGGFRARSIEDLTQRYDFKVKAVQSNLVQKSRVEFTDVEDGTRN